MRMRRGRNQLVLESGAWGAAGSDLISLSCGVGGECFVLRVPRCKGHSLSLLGGTSLGRCSGQDAGYSWGPSGDLQDAGDTVWQGLEPLLAGQFEPPRITGVAARGLMCIAVALLLLSPPSIPFLEPKESPWSFTPSSYIIFSSWPPVTPSTTSYLSPVYPKGSRISPICPQSWLSFCSW